MSDTHPLSKIPGYTTAPDCHTFKALVNTTEDRLLSSVIRNSYHVLRPLFPLSSPNGLAPASELIHLPYPSKMASNVFPVSYTEPCFLLSSPRFVFPIGFSIYLTLFPQQLSQSRSLFI